MIPTLAQVADHARQAYLGDTEVAGGGMWTDSALLGASGLSSTTSMAVAPVAAAYSTLIQALKLTAHRLLRRESYFVIPAYTTVIRPEYIALNLGSPLELRARPISYYATDIDSLETHAPSGLNPPAVDIIFSSPRSFTANSLVQLAQFRGVSDSINDEWCISIPTASSIRLNGCTVDPTPYSPATGIVMTSTTPWPANPIPLVSKLVPELSSPSTATSELLEWSFQSNQIIINPLSTALQGKILYELSPTCPTNINASTGVDGSLDFLACYAAAIATGIKGMSPVSQRLFAQATGYPTGEIGHCNAGLLGQLIRPEVKAQQVGGRVQSPRFRPKRNHGPAILY
jgi:hypothetical protein